jgi:hypothetical protein
MAITGYEKSLDQYSKNELVDIAKKYTIYYQTDSGQGSISNYGSLTKEKLISLIKSDRNYQSAAPPTKKLSRVEIMMQRITPGVDTEDEIMEVIQEVFDDIDSIPKVGNIYTFKYTATTPRIFYDEHPLIFVQSYDPPYFIGFNVHWPDYRNYLLKNVTDQVFHRVQKGEEFDYLHDVPYRKISPT